ncbi:hypothetical protein GN958_ATG10524, partial [Phytophthora infestans]
GTDAQEETTEHAISRRRSRSGGKLPKRRKNDHRKWRSRSHSRAMTSTSDSYESSSASESDTTSENIPTVSNCGSGDGAIVARDDLVHVSKIDVKLFDAWKTLEAFLRSYCRRAYQILYSCGVMDIFCSNIYTRPHKKSKNQKKQNHKHHSARRSAVLQ